MRPGKLQIITDAMSRPDLFVWNGPRESRQLCRWLSENALNNLPEDFVAFLELTGGGDQLESETILGPYGNVELGDDLIGANIRLRSEGMPAGYVVFHQGVDLSAIRSLDDKYVAFTARDFHEKSVFSPWKLGTLRVFARSTASVTASVRSASPNTACTRPRSLLLLSASRNRQMRHQALSVGRWAPTF